MLTRIASLSPSERALLYDSCDPGQPINQEDFFMDHNDSTFFQAIMEDHARKSVGKALAEAIQSQSVVESENSNFNSIVLLN